MKMVYGGNMQSDRLKRLQTERQKLDCLVDEALEKTFDTMTQGGALTGEEIMTQSRKVDGIVFEAERETGGKE